MCTPLASALMLFRSAKRGVVMPTTLSRLAACVACLPAIPCLSLRALHIARSVRPAGCRRSSEQEGESQKKGEALSAHVATRLMVCMLPGLQALHAHADRQLARHPHHMRCLLGCWQVPGELLLNSLSRSCWRPLVFKVLSSRSSFLSCACCTLHTARCTHRSHRPTATPRAPRMHGSWWGFGTPLTLLGI